MIIIKLIDNGCEKYTQQPDCKCLGRRWDNLAEQVQVIKPKGEEHNICAMIIYAEGNPVERILVGNEPINITSVLSQFASVEISFIFSNADGYVKNSEIVSYYFAEARKPDDFVPMTPEQWTNIDVILGDSVVRQVLEGNVIKSYNLVGQVVSEVDLTLLLGLEQDATDNSLTTNSKTIVGAINELNAKLGSSAQTIQDILGV